MDEHSYRVIHYIFFITFQKKRILNILNVGASFMDKIVSYGNITSIEAKLCKSSQRTATSP